MSDAALSIRAATEADLTFVRSSWFESYRHGGFAPQVAFPVYREGQHNIIEGCLRRGRTLVAFATVVPDEVCSWVCVEGSRIIHYVYTKQAYRKMGIARKLVEKASVDSLTEHTHDTRAGRSLAARIGTKLNPYPLYSPSTRSNR